MRPNNTTQRKAPADDVRAWLHHCEESGNFSGAGKALEELRKRGEDPQRYDDPKKDYR